MTEVENRSKTRSLIKVEPIVKNAIDVSEFITKKFDYVIKSDLYNHNGMCLMYDMMREIALDKKNKMIRPIIMLSPDRSIVSATISGNGERHMTRTGVKHDIRGELVEGIDFESELRVLVISPYLSMLTDEFDGLESYQRSIMSNAMGLTAQSFTKHRVNINPANVIYLGIRSDLIDGTEQGMLETMKVKPMIFDLDRIRERSIDRIMSFVANRFRDQKVHVVFDMSAIDISLAPSVFRYTTTQNSKAESNADPDTDLDTAKIKNMYRGLNRDEILRIMQYVALLKENSKLESFDLVGYNFALEENREMVHPNNVYTSKIMLDILKTVADFKDHSINIFDESSRFLIWKKIPKVFTDDNAQETDIEQDTIGWLILRGVDLLTRNSLISHFEQLKAELNNNENNNENNDDIDVETDPESMLEKQLQSLEYPIQKFDFPANIDVNDNPDDNVENDNVNNNVENGADIDETLEVLISVTSPMEQNLKSYHACTSYLDRCLMPGEKVSMTFELLATPSMIQTLNDQASITSPDTDQEFTDVSDSDLIEETQNSPDTENNDEIDEGINVNPVDLDEFRKLQAVYQEVVKKST